MPETVVPGEIQDRWIAQASKYTHRGVSGCEVRLWATRPKNHVETFMYTGAARNIGPRKFETADAA